MSPIPTRANDLSFIFNTLFIVSLKRSGFLAKVVFLHVKGCGFGDIQLIHFLKKKKKSKKKSTFSVQIFAKKFLQLWEFSPSQANHSRGCNRLVFTLNEYKLVMIPGPAVTCIYCCIYPSSCGSKQLYSYTALAAAFFNY